MGIRSSRCQRPSILKSPARSCNRTVLEPIGRDQRESHHAAAEDDVVEDGRGVSRGAAAEHAPGPQSGTHLDGRTQPCGSALVADERAARISLQLNDFEVAQHPLVEALRRCRGPLEPSRDGMAGMARDPGGRRHAHTLDARRLATWSHALRAQRRPLYAVPVCVLTVPPQTVQRYRQRRPHFVGNEPWPTMLRPSFPRLSHPRLAQAIPSIACIAHVYLGGTRGFRPRSRR